MLIMFDDSWVTAIESLAVTQGVVDCIENLAFAHRKGVHWLTGSASVMRALSRIVQGDTRGTLLKIAQRSHERKMFVEGVTDYVVVEPREIGPVAADAESVQRTAYRVPYSFFVPVAASAASRLIVEDADDRDLLIGILRSYVAKRAPRGMRCEVQGFGGGGSSTHDQFADHAERGPTLCFVDSDRVHPDGALGSTARAVLTAHEGIRQSVVARVQVLPSHELENLIPGRLLEDCVERDDPADLGRRCQEVIVILARSSADQFRYLDLKNGLCGRDVLLADPACQRYLAALVASRISSSCIDGPMCVSRAGCACRVFEGIGGGFVRRSARKISEMTPHKAAEYFFAATSDWSGDWGFLAHVMYSWAIAPAPSRT